MSEIILIEPEWFADQNNLAYVRPNLRPQEGWYVGRVPKTYDERLINLLNQSSLDDEARRGCKEYLCYLQKNNRLVNIDIPGYITEGQWTDIVLKCLEARELSKRSYSPSVRLAICREPPNASTENFFITGNGVAELDTKRRAGPLDNENEVLQFLYLPLRQTEQFAWSSRRLHLEDNDLSRQFFKWLVKLLDICEGSLCSRIYIHTDAPPIRNNQRDGFRKEYEDKGWVHQKLLEGISKELSNSKLNHSVIPVDGLYYNAWCEVPEDDPMRNHSIGLHTRQIVTNHTVIELSNDLGTRDQDGHLSLSHPGNKEEFEKMRDCWLGTITNDKRTFRTGMQEVAQVKLRRSDFLKKLR